MHPGVAKISLDVLARKLHDQKIANKHSPVSSDIKLLEDRLKNLLATKRARVTLIGASNRVRFLFLNVRLLGSCDWSCEYSFLFI